MTTTRGPQKRYTDMHPGKPISFNASPINKDSTFDSTYGADGYPSTSSRIPGSAAGNSPTLNESSIRGGSCRSRRFDSDDSYTATKSGNFSNDSTFASDESSYGDGRYPSTSSRYRPGGNSPTLNESSIRSDSRRSDSTYADRARSANNDSSTFATANNDSSTFASDDSSYGNGRYPSTSSRYRPGGNSPTLNESSIRSDSRRSDSSYAGRARSANNDSSTFATANNDFSTFASDDSSYGNGRYPSTSSRYPNRPAGNSPTLNESSIRSDSRSDPPYYGQTDPSTFGSSDDSSYGNGRYPSTSSRYPNRPGENSPSLNESSIRGSGASTSSRKSSSSPGYSPTLDVSPISKVPNDDDVFLPSSRAGKVPPRKRLDFASAARMDSSSELSPGYSPENGNRQMQKKNLSVDQLPTDEYVGSQKVANLDKTNFYDLLGSKDITLVFFYDPRNPESALYKDNIKQASGCTKRANHAFAAVNCKTSRDLCLMAGVLKAPMLKLYSGLKPIEDIKNSKTTADDIRRTVEQG